MGDVFSGHASALQGGASLCVPAPETYTERLHSHVVYFQSISYVCPSSSPKSCIRNPLIFKMCSSHSLSITVENKMMVLLKTYGLNILLKYHSHVQTTLNFIAVDLKTRYLEMDFILIFKLLNSECTGKTYSTFCLHSGALEIITLKLVFVSGFFSPKPALCWQVNV